MKTDRTPEVPAEIVQALTDNHRRFLSFLERRVSSREVAEDLLQEAFVRGLRHAGGLRNEQAVVPWFFRLLRNALTDYYRHRGVERRTLAPAEEAGNPADPASADPALHQEICRCVADLIRTLKPEYETAVRRVDLEGATLGTFAAESGITPNTAAVRLHRARRALRQRLEQSCGTCATHGCLDCSCGHPRARPTPP